MTHSDAFIGSYGWRVCGSLWNLEGFGGIEGCSRVLGTYKIIRQVGE